MRLRGFYAGATDPIRTDDLLITSELLYLLSHSSTLLAYYSKQNVVRQEGILSFLKIIFLQDFRDHGARYQKALARQSDALVVDSDK